MRLDHLLSKEYFLYFFESGWTHATLAAEQATKLETTMRAHTVPVRGGRQVINALSGVWHDTAHTSSSGVAWFVCGTVTPAGTIRSLVWSLPCVVCENWRVDASILFFLLLFEFFAFLVIRFVFV